ncbi:hypothetical protein BDZ89DRAFT_1111959 [Hymenopellis radicata]|nr:hypothetical protein BDZ89DRAFT_1111959 [Hymenopellis radicata]
MLTTLPIYKVKPHFNVTLDWRLQCSLELIESHLALSSLELVLNTFVVVGLNVVLDSSGMVAFANMERGIEVVGQYLSLTAVFGATWLTIWWVYPIETLPLEVRAKGNARGVVGWRLVGDV